MKTVGALVALLWMLSGCGLGPADENAPTVVAVVADVYHYPGCGYGSLIQDGVTYYQLYPADVDALDTSRYPRADAPREADTRVLTAVRGAGSVGGVGRIVAPPGPGDDIGTLVIYSDGYAHFTSDSGERSVWFTTAPHAYAFPC